MNEGGSASSEENAAGAPVFISYATADRAEAMKVCKAIERRGPKCWISTRDVPPGANYQEAIVQSLRSARAVVLVFSDAANSSDEIKKELSLASRYRVPVIALRLKDVEPSDAFAYELSTRQWVDAFAGWDKAIDLLVGRIAETPGAPTAPTPTAEALKRRAAWSPKVAAAVAGVLLLATAIGAWWWLKPSPTAAHSMTVRLAGFKPLSADLQPTIRDAVDAEISAAFNADGVVGVSTASAPPAGTAPAYALGGTIEREGNTIRVITRLTNERSGATLWTNNYNYDGNEVSRVPRRIAVDAGNVVRCGLFGASTYGKTLPDLVLRDYLQFCQAYWDPNMEEGRKALIPAQRVVAAVPDFSWGWAGVAGAYWKVTMSAGDERLVEQARAAGREAADRGIAIDGKNSEALYIKAMLLKPRDWAGRDALLSRAVAAKRLDCGCEHHQYGWLLMNVGRVTDAVDQLRQADDTLALYVYTALTLADGLVATEKFDEARQHYDAAIDIAPNAEFARFIRVSRASLTGDVDQLLDPKLPLSAPLRAALVEGHRALASKDAAAKAHAVQTLLKLPQEQQVDAVALLLGRLGSSHGAFQVAARLATTQDYPGPSLFWYRGMRGTLDDPGFPALAKQLGLLDYWQTSHTKPDVCSEKGPPPFCRILG